MSDIACNSFEYSDAKVKHQTFIESWQISI